MVLVFVARLAMAVQLNLFPDETLYAWQSETMPGSFSPHPPGVLLMVRTGIALLGKTELGVRIFPLLLSTLCVVPMWLLAREIGLSQHASAPQSVSDSRNSDSRNVKHSRDEERAQTTAFWSVLALLAAPIYFAFGAITTPDGGQLFFWLCGLLFVWRALNTNRMRWWVATGAIIGMGLFVKYILILFFPALFLCLLLTPQWRRKLFSPGPYVAIVVALLLFLPPFLAFEYSSGWMTVQYHLGDRQNKQAINLLEVAIYQGIHAAYLSPLLYIGAIWGAIWALRQGVKSDKVVRDAVNGDAVNSDAVNGAEVNGDEVKEGRAALIFLFCFAAVPYLFFALIASVTKRDLSREQWDAPSYLSALVAGVLMVQHKMMQHTMHGARGLRWQKWGVAAICLGFAMSLGTVLEATGNLWSRALSKPPFLSKLLYSREMAHQIDERVRSASPKPDYVVGGNFTTTLAYAFYGREVRRFYTVGHNFNARYGLVDVLRSIEIDSDFARREQGRNALVVFERGGDPLELRRWRQQRTDNLRAAFTSVREEPPLEIRHQGRFVTRFYLWQCRGLEKIPAGWLLDLSK